jgi:hypothetical protein
MLLKRWASLLQTLRIGLRAARELGDEATIAWAEHELGTLKLAAGDVEGAERNLRQAREIRERIGDRPGLAATNRNLGALCERLRNMVRDEELVRRSGRRRPSFARTLALAALCVVFFGGGVAAGTIAGDDPGREPVAKERTEANDDSPSGPRDRSVEGSDGNATTPPTTTVETVPPVVETVPPSKKTSSNPRKIPWSPRKTAGELPLLLKNPFELLGEPEDVRQLHVHRVGEPAQGAPLGVEAAALDHLELRHRDLRPLAELLLRQPCLFPQLANSVAEGDVVYVPGLHL